MAVLDLDKFKALNDSRGHHIGDMALKLLADILRKHTRKTDSIGRLGGDEFAILMPNTRGVDCVSLCHQLCEKIESGMAASGFKITSSIGYSTYTQSPESSLQALRRTNQAMYVAKATGNSCAAAR